MTGIQREINRIRNEVNGQSALIEQIAYALEGKAAGGSGGAIGNLTKYTKIIATPQSTTSFTIDNPLGGIAKKVSIQRVNTEPTSSRRCLKYLADYDLEMGVGYYTDTGGSARYTSVRTAGTVSNSQFKMTEGSIIIYRYNSANAWDTSEYEVEIWQ
jgi:hypothetical protein